MKRLALFLVLLLLPALAPAGDIFQNGFRWSNGVWWGADGIGYRPVRTGCCGWRYVRVSKSYATPSNYSTTNADNSVSVSLTFNNVQQLAPAGASGYAAVAPTIEYSGVDYDAQIQGAFRLSEQALAGGLNTLGNVIAEDAQVTRLRAQAALITASAAAVASDGGPDFQVNIDGDASVTTGGGRDGGGDFQALGTGAAMTVLQSRCAGCHSGDRLEGGLDLALWPDFTLAEKRAVWKRLRTTDESKVMPRDPETGGPGEPLTASELSILSLDIADSALQEAGP